jgi:hypothetical protein
MSTSDITIELNTCSLNTLISKQFLTALEAAYYLGVTVNNLKKICALCPIPHRIINGKLFFQKSDLEYLMVLSRQGTDNTKQYIALLNEKEYNDAGNHAE